MTETLEGITKRQEGKIPKRALIGVGLIYALLLYAVFCPPYVRENRCENAHNSLPEEVREYDTNKDGVLDSNEIKSYLTDNPQKSR